jgi:hypothetical protein
MFQLLLDDRDNPVAVFRVNVPLVENEGQVAVAIVVTPLETLLAPGMRVRIDESEPAGVPYTLCEPTGCLARIPLTQENVAAFQAGADVFLEIFALVRSDMGEIGGVPVALTASLRGFTAAFNALQERHTSFAAFVAERQARPATVKASKVKWLRPALQAVGRDPQDALRKTSTAFSPPKAKALDRTASTCASRATFGTTSSAHSGSGSS